MKVNHTIKPVYDKNSKVLILGSMPSVKSRELGFYYSHPKNRFWKTLEKVYEEEIGNTKDDKIKFLRKHHIALFDVLKSCDISASSDSTIKNPVPNDLLPILEKADIKAIFIVGRKAYELYKKYCYKSTNIEAILLPSTSSANCMKGIKDELINSFSQIRQFTD